MALCGAARDGQLQLVKYPIKKGADDDRALRSSAYCNHFNFVKNFVKRGANIYARDNEILKTASKNGFVEIIKFLAENVTRKTALTRKSNMNRSHSTLNYL